MLNLAVRDVRLVRASELVIQKIAAMEQLEGRRLMHAGHEHTTLDPYNLNPSDGHISASEFRRLRPEFADVENLWEPSVFNPGNSLDRSDWLYDPHAIEDESTPLLPDAPLFASPEAVQLPDLVPLTGGSNLNPFIDQTEIAGHNLLRFTTAIGNQGTGPAILTSANSGIPPAGSGITSWINPDGSQNLLQQLYDFTPNAGLGTFTFNSYRPAGRMVWHSGHNHFHLEGYASYRLLTNVGGQPGPVATRVNFDGSPAVGDKVGFCLVNISDSFTMTNGQSSTTLQGYDPVGDQSTASTNGQPRTTCGFLQGIHVGHADVYSSIYDGQWIDVTGVPNGSYFLEVTLDAQNVIQESNEVNNTVFVPVTLNTTAATGGSIQPDRFEPNNDFGDAEDLGVLGVTTEPGLTAHISGESDYFRFTAASSGTYNIQLQIANRDMNLYLYDSDRVLLASSTTSASGTTTTPVLETISRAFVAGETYYIRAVGFGSDLNPTTSAISSNYSLKTFISPTVNTSTPDSQAGELGLSPGTIRLARNGPVAGGLNINIAVTGGATRGSDYAIYHDNVLITGNTISIGTEATVADLEIRPLADAQLEALETVIVTVNSSTAYVVGGTNSGTVTLHDTPPQVTANNFAFDTLPLQLSFDFTLDVSASLATGDVEVLRDGGRDPIPVDGVSYNGAANRGTFAFNSPLLDGNYSAAIAAANVTHALGEPLAASAVATFFVFAGDANHDRSVDIGDFAALGANFNAPGTFSQGNFNYDALVDIADFAILAAKFNTSLPAARGAAPIADVRTSSMQRNPFADGAVITRVIDELENEIANSPV